MIQWGKFPLCECDNLNSDPQNPQRNWLCCNVTAGWVSHCCFCQLDINSSLLERGNLNWEMASIPLDCGPVCWWHFCINEWLWKGSAYCWEGSHGLYKKTDWAMLWKQASKQCSTIVQFATIPALSFCPGFPSWWTQTWDICNTTFSSPTRFWSWLPHSKREAK